MHDTVGKAAIRFAFSYVRHRYRREIPYRSRPRAHRGRRRAYLASHNVPEG